MAIAEPSPFGPTGASWRCDLRASDLDRELTVDALRRHSGHGRLTFEELAERIDRVYAARTLGDLDELVRDLPVARPSARSGTVIPPAVMSGRMAARRRRVLWLAMRLAIIDLVCVAIWFMSSPAHVEYFWPVWPIILTATWVAFGAVNAVERRNAG